MPVDISPWMGHDKFIESTPPMTAIHTLTNGTQNFVFEATAQETILKTINVFGGLEKTEALTTPEARTHWAFALKCGCTKGWTAPQYREQPSAYDEEPLYCD